MSKKLESKNFYCWRNKNSKFKTCRSNGPSKKDVFFMNDNSGNINLNTFILLDEEEKYFKTDLSEAKNCKVKIVKIKSLEVV